MANFFSLHKKANPVALIVVVGLVAALGINKIQSSNAATGGQSLAECQAQPQTTPTGTITDYKANTSGQTYNFKNALIKQQGTNDYSLTSNGDNICIMNAQIDGQGDPSWTWEFIKRDHNGAAFFPTGSATYWNVRADQIDNDMFRLQTGSSFSINGAYGTDIRDDCISDSHVALYVSDTLCESYTGISWRHVRGTAGTNFPLTVKNSLFYIKPMPNSGSDGTCQKWRLSNGYANGTFWKMDSFTGSPSLFNISDTIIRIDTPNYECGNKWANATYKNVKIVWTGGGDYWNIIGETQPAGITTTSDISVWNNAKSAWLTAHNCPGSGSPHGYGGLCAPVASTPPSDTTVPTASLTSPAASTTLSGTINLAATATDNVGVTKVNFLVDGTLVGSDTSSPYNFSFNTTSIADGSHTFQAKAYDAAGNIGASATITATIKNTVATDPTLAIQGIASGQTVSGGIPVGASASSPSGITEVDFYLDGVMYRAEKQLPYCLAGDAGALQNATTCYNWDSSKVVNGTHTIKATAINTKGVSASKTVTFTVSNAVAPPSAPVNLKASAASATQVNLTWTPPTSTLGITSYLIIRNSVVIGSATGSTSSSYNDPTVQSATTYNYVVKAVSSSGTNSPASNTASVTTPALPVADTTAPSAPTGLVGTAASTSQINLSWKASTDNIGVVGYKVSRNNNVVAKVTVGTSFGDSGLAAGTTYTYTVSAYDAAGNTSPNSASTAIATSPVVSSSGPCGTTATAPATMEHIVWIWFENKSRSEITAANAPYFTSLAKSCGSATAYMPLPGSIQHPSLSNYLAATSGDPQGVNVNCEPTGSTQSSTKGVCPTLTVNNLFRQVRRAGLTERSYQESMSSNCNLNWSPTTGTNQLYKPKHNPAAYYTGNSGEDRSACKSNNLPMGTTSSGNFLNALNNGTLPAFSFITPNLCNSVHDCSISTGDSWLKSWMTKITASSNYKAGKTAVFIVFDECNDDTYASCLNYKLGNTPDANSTTYAAVVSPSTPQGTVTNLNFTHYSLLRTTEELLNINTFLSNAGGATSMKQAFNL